MSETSLDARFKAWVNQELAPKMRWVSFNAQVEIPTILVIYIYIILYIMYTSSTAQGGGGSFKNRKPIGEIGCCESGMAEQIHWWTERCLRSPLFLSLSLTIYPPTNLSSMHLSIYRSIYPSLSLSLSLFHLITYLSILSCLVLSCLVLSCPVLSCPVLSCPVLSCPVLSCPVLSCPVLSCPVLSCPVLSVCLSICRPVYLWCSVIQCNVV